MTARIERSGGGIAVAGFAVNWRVASAAGLLAGALVLGAAALWMGNELERARLEAEAATLFASAEAQRSITQVEEPANAALSAANELPSARRARLADQPPPGAIVVRAAPLRTDRESSSPADWRRGRRWRSDASPYGQVARQLDALMLPHERDDFQPGDFDPVAERPSRGDELITLDDGKQIPRWAVLQGRDPLQTLDEQQLLEDLWRASTDVGLDEEVAGRLAPRLAARLSLPAPPPANHTLDDPHLKQEIQGRSEFAGLPFIWGAASQCTPSEAESFDKYSRNVRLEVRGLRGSQRDEALQKVLSHERWTHREAFKALNQMLPAESVNARLLWCDLLAAQDDIQATESLAKVAVFDPAPSVRGYARTALSTRPARDYRHILLAAMRFPWPAAAQHAAETLVAVDDQNAVGVLTEMLDLPDPRLARQQEDGSWVRPQLVRINHQKNCLLCHATAGKDQPLLRASINGEIYYADRTGPFVRADITYLRQEFSMSHVVAMDLRDVQTARFDYFVQLQTATADEVAYSQSFQAAAATAANSRPIPAALTQVKQPLLWRSPQEAPQGEANPYRQATLFALTRLTALNAGDSSTQWREAYWDRWAGPDRGDADNGQPEAPRRVSRRAEKR